MELTVTMLALYFTDSSIRLGVEIVGPELQKRKKKSSLTYLDRM